MTAEVLKIVPSPDELWITNRHSQHSLQCTEMGCSYVAANSSVLGLHKAKVHNIKIAPEKGSVVHYHCPVEGCYFNPNSERYFKSLDILRTHYMKVHSEKKFSCVKCSKSFGLERDCHRHEKECGKEYSCPDCGKTYTNRPALWRHCDWKRHKKPEIPSEPKPVKEKAAVKCKKIVKKPCKVSRGPLPFILPKQLPPQLLPQSQHIEIQTDASGTQYIISKLTSDSSVSQAVQTVSTLNIRKSAGIQTTQNFQSRQIGTSTSTDRLSTGIQTVVPHFPASSGSAVVAQTQTKESILQKAMAMAKIPHIKVSKATQNSSTSTSRKKKKSNVSCTAGSQTINSAVSQKRRRTDKHESNTVPMMQSKISHDKEIQMGIIDMDDFMSTMSTQTNLSCVSEQLLQPGWFAPKAQLQDCHTQTHSDFINSRWASIGSQMQKGVLNSNQVTQTKLYDISNDQNTQTGNLMSFPGPNNPMSGFLSIQDTQTQTSFLELSAGLNHSSQTQTQISSLANVPGVQDQGTMCDELLGPHTESTRHEMSVAYLSQFENQIELANPSIVISLENENHNTSNNLSLSESTQALNKLLMEVTEGGEELNSSGAPVLTQSVASMETQTFGNMGMDCMTQTMEDLGWDMGTQTVDDLVNDMMTQTGDELLDFLTSDTQTQTLDNFCGDLVSQDKFYAQSSTGTSTADIEVQSGFERLFGDHASTQTPWDNEDQELDFQNSSFVAPLPTAAGKNGADTKMKPGIFLEKETSVQVDFLSHSESSGRSDMGIFDDYPMSETVGTQLNLSDLARVTETSETQTMYDPIFSHLDHDDNPLSFNAGPPKYMESSQTQTTSDPMLPTSVSDEDLFTLSQEGVLPKDNSETQTEEDNCSPSMTETVQCQTSWDIYATSFGTSETQTCSSDYVGISCNGTQTQTGLSSDLLSNLELTDSFTQTNVDQNTQTGFMFDF